jgi:hypothetical protein
MLIRPLSAEQLWKLQAFHLELLSLLRPTKRAGSAGYADFNPLAPSRLGAQSAAVPSKAKEEAAALKSRKHAQTVAGAAAQRAAKELAVVLGVI